MTEARFPRLHPAQVCFVVEDVDTAVDECVASFGWGPFHRFTAPVPEARYHDWVGPKKTDVALGMAGGVQVELDRVTIVTDDLDRALAFYARAFRWEDAQIESRTLRVGSVESSTRRARGQAGQLLFELVEPPRGGADPYARHLARGDHGLVHAGGVSQSGELPADATAYGEWLEDGEAFALYAWSGGSESLQLRRASA